MDADHEFVAGERIHQPEVSGPHENTIGLKTRKAVKPGCYPNRLIEPKPLRLKLLGDSLRVERNENVAQFSRGGIGQNPVRGHSVAVIEEIANLCAIGDQLNPRQPPGGPFYRREALYAGSRSGFLPLAAYDPSVTFHVIGQADSRLPREPRPREFLAVVRQVQGEGWRRRVADACGRHQGHAANGTAIRLSALSAERPIGCPHTRLTAAKALAGTPTLQRNLLKVRFAARLGSAAGSPWGGSLALRPDVRCQVAIERLWLPIPWVG